MSCETGVRRKVERVLVIGGAGYVGGILRPALEEQFGCSYLDRSAVDEAEDRSYVGDLEDEALLAQAMEGVDAVIYLAMGPHVPRHERETNIRGSFNVNVRGVYRALEAAIEANVSVFTYASSLSVYAGRSKMPIDESVPPNSPYLYGLTKYLGEEVCRMLSHRAPQMTILALRLIHPRREGDWEEMQARLANPEQFANKPRRLASPFALGPNDTRRLFLAALACETPGFHALQTSGDLTGEHWPNTQAEQLLGWTPEKA